MISDLRSCGTRRLVQPPVHRSTVASRALPVAGPTAVEHFTVRGDVGAVAGDLPQATEFAHSFPDIHMHLVDNYANFRRLLKGHNVWLLLRRLVTLLFFGRRVQIYLLSASAVVIHYEEALYQVYAPLPFTYLLTYLLTYMH